MRSRRMRVRGALLLEAIVALTIMVLALGFMGAQLVNGVKLIAESDVQTRAVQFTERMLSLLELDQSITAAFFANRTSDGDFGDENPGWHWRAYVEPVPEHEGLGTLTLEILRVADLRVGDSIDNAQVVRRVRMLKADPGRLNLAADFGLEAEVMEQMAQSVPIPGFDPTQLDPQQIVSMDPATLLQLLPVLLPIIQQFAQSRGMQLPPGGLEGMTPEQLQEQMERLQQGGGDDRSGGDVESSAGQGGTQSRPPAAGRGGTRATPGGTQTGGGPQNIQGLNENRNNRNGSRGGGR